MEGSGLPGWPFPPHFPNTCDSPTMKEGDNKILCDHFMEVRRRHLLKGIMA